MKQYITKNRHYTIISIVSLVFIWKIASVLKNNEAILPPPESILIGVINLLSVKSTFIVIGHTLQRGLIGFFISLVLGIALGTLSGLKPYVEKLLSPVLTILKSTPIIAVIILLYIMIGTEKTPIFATTMIAFPIIYTNVLEGTKNVDANLVKMAKLYNVSRFNIIKDIYLPSTAPFIFAGMETAFSIGWKVTVTSEVLSVPKYAIGSEMWLSKNYLDLDTIFAWTIITVIISYIFELLIKATRKKFIRWNITNES